MPSERATQTHHPGTRQEPRFVCGGQPAFAADRDCALFEAHEGTRIEPRFGASGLLRDEITAKGQADVFATWSILDPWPRQAEAVLWFCSPPTACACSSGPA